MFFTHTYKDVKPKHMQFWKKKKTKTRHIHIHIYTLSDSKHRENPPFPFQILTILMYNVQS